MPRKNKVTGFSDAEQPVAAPAPAAQTAMPATTPAMSVPPHSHMAVSPDAAAMAQMQAMQPYTSYPAAGMVQMQAQMMQMMQMMMGGHMGIPGVDSAAQPFSQAQAVEDKDAGLDADLIRPDQMRSVIKSQLPLPVQEVLDCLCLTEDGKCALGGIPKGCTIAFAGPPGKGKTRTAIAALCKVAYQGMRSGFVVAEEGFIDTQESGRDDLCSRLTKIGMKVLGITEANFQKTVARNLAVLLSQYHKGQTWDTFVTRYRFMVEKEGVRFVVIDSLNMLDPGKTRTADNLAALKTYNHEKGVTCLTIGQIKDTGMPVGGESLIHTADTVFLLEDMSLTSKEMAEFWGGAYRDHITVIRAVKSVTTPIFPYPLRVDYDKESGVLKVHALQPKQYQILPPMPAQ
jgi:KaiC/GvpD/RAD55 family RecA-like ATPase